MAFGDVYKITVSGDMAGQVVEAVFNFKHLVGETTANATTWAETFKTDILTPMMTIAHEDLEYTFLQVVNWRDPADFIEESINYAGDVPAEGNDRLASWLTLNFRFNRNNPGQSHGFKRFAGGVESMFTDGEPVALWATEMEAVRVALQTGLTASLDRTCRYWVVDSTASPAYGANPAGYASSSVLYRGLGTQKSRKS